MREGLARFGAAFCWVDGEMDPNVAVAVGMYIGFRDSHSGRRRPLSLSSGWPVSLLSLSLRFQQPRPNLRPRNVLLLRGWAVQGIVRAATGTLSETLVLSLRAGSRSVTARVWGMGGANAVEARPGLPCDGVRPGCHMPFARQLPLGHPDC
jgi:hypothetical protein